MVMLECSGVAMWSLGCSGGCYGVSIWFLECCYMATCGYWGVLDLSWCCYVVARVF